MSIKRTRVVAWTAGYLGVHVSEQATKRPTDRRTPRQPGSRAGRQAGPPSRGSNVTRKEIPLSFSIVEPRGRHWYRHRHQDPQPAAPATTTTTTTASTTTGIRNRYKAIRSPVDPFDKIKQFLALSVDLASPAPRLTERSRLAVYRSDFARRGGATLPATRGSIRQTTSRSSYDVGSLDRSRQKSS